MHILFSFSFVLGFNYITKEPKILGKIPFVTFYLTTTFRPLMI